MINGRRNSWRTFVLLSRTSIVDSVVWEAVDSDLGGRHRLGICWRRPRDQRSSLSSSVHYCWVAQETTLAGSREDTDGTKWVEGIWHEKVLTKDNDDYQHSCEETRGWSRKISWTWKNWWRSTKSCKANLFFLENLRTNVIIDLYTTHFKEHCELIKREMKCKEITCSALSSKSWTVNDGSGVVDEVTRHKSTTGRGAETEKIVMRTSMEERPMVRPGFDKQRPRKGRQRLTRERRQQG